MFSFYNLRDPKTKLVGDIFRDGGNCEVYMLEPHLKKKPEDQKLTDKPEKISEQKLFLG